MWWAEARVGTKLCEPQTVGLSGEDHKNKGCSRMLQASHDATDSGTSHLQEAGSWGQVRPDFTKGFFPDMAKRHLRPCFGP